MLLILVFFCEKENCEEKIIVNQIAISVKNNRDVMCYVSGSALCVGPLYSTVLFCSVLYL